MSKRIIFCVTNDLNTDQRMIRICTSLQDAGYATTLVGRQRQDSLPLKERKFKQVRLNCFFSSGKFFYLEYNIRLLFWLFFQATDAICAIDLDTIVPATIVAKLKGKKMIYDAHEYFPYVPEVIERPFTQKIWLWVEKTCLPKCDLVYTVSGSIANEFQKHYGKQVYTIRNVSFEREWTDIEKPKKNIVYQGALNTGRGLEQLIEACKGKNYVLFLYGDGDVKQKLQDLVNSYGLEKQVLFKGKVSPDELWKETRQAYIGINFAENKSLSYWLSLSNKLFDYIQAGVPQVMMNFPEFVALNEPNPFGVVIDDLKPETIQIAIDSLLNNANLYNQLRNNCVALRKELTWENESVKLVQYYHELFK
jgi:glycosyltransferase involved in cell wall biosynthesis